METLCTTKKSLEQYVERFDFNTIMYISYNQIEYFLGKDIRTIFEYIEYFSKGKVGYFYYFDKYMAYQFYKKNGYKIISELNNIPIGYKKFHLIKEL